MPLMPFASPWPHSYLSRIGILPPFTTIPGKQEEPQEDSLYPVFVLSKPSPHRRTPKTKVGQEVAALLSQKSVGSQGSGSLLESDSSTSGSAAGLAEQVSATFLFECTHFSIPCMYALYPFITTEALGPNVFLLCPSWHPSTPLQCIPSGFLIARQPTRKLVLRLLAEVLWYMPHNALWSGWARRTLPLASLQVMRLKRT